MSHKIANKFIPHQGTCHPETCLPEPSPQQPQRPEQSGPGPPKPLRQPQQPGMAMHGHVRATEKVIAVNEDEELRRRGFNLGATLGEGSYAKVKCAFWNHINKRVAIKIINKKKAPRDFQTRFLPRELEIMKKIKHPHIIELYEILHLNGKVYMILEMAGHGDLLEYIKLRGAIPEDKAKALYYQLLQAVSYLHSISIVHRDLKCENVLLDAKNQIKVSDFGFARRQGVTDFSSTFCGSAAYAAPEILQGIPYIGKAYDVWSLGVILYIMVGGSMPYDDSNIKKMIRYQTERKVGFSKSRHLSSDVKSLIHHMLEAKVDDRYTVEQVINSPWLAAVVRPKSRSPGSGHTADAGRHEERVSHGQLQTTSRLTPIENATEDSGHRDQQQSSAGRPKYRPGGQPPGLRTRVEATPMMVRPFGEERDDRDMVPMHVVPPGQGGEMAGHMPLTARAVQHPPNGHNNGRTKPCTAHPGTRVRQPCPCPNCQREHLSTAAGLVMPTAARHNSPQEVHGTAVSRETPAPVANMTNHQHEPRDRVWRTDADK